MTQNLTVFKLTSDKKFTPGKTYKICHGKHSIALNCLHASLVDNKWLFSTEKTTEDIAKFFIGGTVNANLTSDNGVIKTLDNEIKFLPFVVKENLIENITDDESCGEIHINGVQSECISKEILKPE
jgi:hypothetical protein